MHGLNPEGGPVASREPGTMAPPQVRLEVYGATAQTARGALRLRLLAEIAALGTLNRGSGKRTMANVLRIQPYSRAVVDGVAGNVSAEDKLGGSICKTVTTRLQIWSNP
jgi:hypothetical protein